MRISEEVLQQLEQIYKPVEIPKCHVCGEEMTLGDSRDWTFGCSGLIEDPNKKNDLIYKEGRSFLEDHYKLSRRTMHHMGDKDVYDLIQAYRKLCKK